MLKLTPCKGAFILYDGAPVWVMLLDVSKTHVSFCSEVFEDEATYPRPLADNMIEEGCKAFLLTPQAERLAPFKRTLSALLATATPDLTDETR